MFSKFNKYFGNASAWVVIGMSGILVVVVISLALMNYNRERDYMVKILSEKGAALIRAFEAGVRTGMMGQFGTLPRLDTLIRETANQQDILYIAIVGSNGLVLAHNNSEKVGTYFSSKNDIENLNAVEDVKWRVVEGNDATQAFEVYKLFLPVLPAPPQSQMMQQRRKMMQTRMGVWCDPQWMDGTQQDNLLQPSDRPTIVIGMDVSSFEEAIQEDIKFTILISGILLLLAMAGMVSLFWAQNYTRSKKLLSNVSAFASEMIANLPEGILLTDNEFRVHYINQIASVMLGIDSNSVIGRNVKDVLPADIHLLGTSVNKDEMRVEKETEIKLQNGSVIPASVVATDVIAEDGTFVGLMYILKNLTQLKQLQLEIQRKEKLAVIGNLAAGVAHEVRNPLSSIKGYATYFRGLFPEDSENREAANVLVAETERLNRVITELLEISRPSDIKPKETDIRSIFNTTLRLVQADSTADQNVEISLTVEDTLSGIYVDPDRFVQVLMNIFLNSIQAMPNGGILHTHVSLVGNQIVIKITDTGLGMIEETVQQIFNPYYTTKKTGTGLGLAIVQKIVEAHDGRISVVSERGKGTSVTITLPNTKR